MGKFVEFFFAVYRVAKSMCMCKRKRVRKREETGKFYLSILKFESFTDAESVQHQKLMMIVEKNAGKARAGEVESKQ